MILTTILVFNVVFLLLGLAGYFIWAMQKKIDGLSYQLFELSKKLDKFDELELRLTNLTAKVTAGEEAISENFEVIEKRLLKVEHEYKEFQAQAVQKRAETLRAAKAFARRTGADHAE